ncbi:MAG TPA: hypothetical protein VMF61_01905 [Candidatus Acidoferrales bacterium]|nr:hypothetical protein [Candidatus Acidoferrales bacterium]
MNAYTRRLASARVSVPAASRSRTAALTVAAVLLFGAVQLAAYHVPLNDSSLFEYFGLRIAHGAVLYRDLFDNKLPSIYLVDALYQLAFGSNYALHALAETVLGAASIVLFASIARRDALRYPGTATLVFGCAFAACTGLMRGGLNMCEVYAVFFTLLALRSSQAELEAPAGASLIAAATFWVPSLLFAVPLFFRTPGARQRWGLVLGIAIGVAGFTLLFAAFADAGNLLRAMQGWGAYERSYPRASLQGLHEAAWLFVHVIAFSVPGVLATLALACIGRPASRQQWFGVLWTVAAIGGGVINPKFWFAWHYAVPAIPALTYLAFSFLPRAIGVRQVVVAALAAFVCAGTAHAAASRAVQNRATARRAAVASSILRASLPASARIAVYTYEPTMYLLSGLQSAEPFEYTLFVLPESLTPSSRLRQQAMIEEYYAAYSGASALVVDTPFRDATVRSIVRDQFSEICRGAVAPWRLYLRRELASRAACNAGAP